MFKLKSHWRMSSIEVFTIINPVFSINSILNGIFYLEIKWALQEAVYQMESQRQEHSSVWAGLMCPISSRSEQRQRATIISGAGSDPQGSEVSPSYRQHRHTPKSSRQQSLTTHTPSMTVPYDDGWNFSTESNSRTTAEQI